MKALIYILLGVLFGIVMTKSEAVSWFRIQEMFRFQSFHMYGIILTAVIFGVIGVALIKRFQLKDYRGRPIVFENKAAGFWRYILGGTIFGLGWALTGACPGPMFVNFGFGFLSFSIVIIFALLGTFIFGLLQKHLP